MDKPAVEQVAADTINDDVKKTDEGWSVESFSKEMTEAPVDTTQQVQQSGADKPAAKKESTTQPPADGDGTTEESGAVVAQAKTVVPPVGKAKKSPDTRVQSLTKDIDRLTYQKHQTDREYQKTQADLAKAKTELQQVQDAIKAKAVPGVATTEKPATAAQTAAGRPVVPKYRDFETDEEYESAMAAWTAQDQLWLENREAQLKKDMDGAIEQRFQKREADEQAREQDTALVGRLTAAREAHPDWYEKAESLKDLRSNWYNPEKHGPEMTAPFIADLSLNAEDGPELLYWLGSLAASEPDRAQAVVDLFPTKQLRDAILHASSPIALLDHFSTGEGQKDFNELKAMHPVRMQQTVGALSARLTAASGGPAVGTRHTITSANPSAKPPAGTSRTGAASAPGTGSQTFDAWMKDEDEKEARAKAKTRAAALGIQTA